MLKIPIGAQDHHRGPVQAPVHLVEYGDFECPYCARAYPHIEKLVEEFGLQLCFAYRHFPLRNSHPHAELAALAAEAADEQSQFWPMHHLLYENYNELSSDTILTLAESLRLNLDRFEKDLARDDLKRKVDEDLAGGVRSGVDETPTVFLNGARLEAPPDYAMYKSWIQTLLKKGEVWAQT